MTRSFLTITTILSLMGPAAAQSAERAPAEDVGAAYYGVWCNYGENEIFSPSHESRGAPAGGVWRLTKQSSDLTQNELLGALSTLELVSGAGESFEVDSRETYRSVTIPVPPVAVAGETFLLRSTATQEGIVLDVVEAENALPFIVEAVQLAEPLAAEDCSAECAMEGDFAIPRANQVTITYRGEAAVLDAFVDVEPEFAEATQRYVDTTLLPRSETSTSVTLKVAQLVDGSYTQKVTLRFRSAASDAELDTHVIEEEVPEVFFDFEAAGITYDCDEYYDDYYYDDIDDCSCSSTSGQALFASLLAGLALLRRRRRCR